MPDYYKLHLKPTPEYYGRKDMDIRLQLEPTKDFSNCANQQRTPSSAGRYSSPEPRKMNFYDDLYDGFIDSRMYSCLNVGNYDNRNSEKVERRYYNRNVFDAPGSSMFNNSDVPEAYKLRRRRAKHIQDKAYYPGTDSDSATSRERTNSNPFIQKIPIFLYEHYDKKNKYLPKASRRAHKCKLRPDCCPPIPDCCKEHYLAPAENEELNINAASSEGYCKSRGCKGPRSKHEDSKTEVVYVKPPDSTTGTSVSAPLVCPEVCDEPAKSNDCCQDIKAKISELQKEISLLEEKEIKTHDINNSRLSKWSTKLTKFSKECKDKCKDSHRDTHKTSSKNVSKHKSPCDECPLNSANSSPSSYKSHESKHSKAKSTEIICSKDGKPCSEAPSIKKSSNKSTPSKKEAKNVEVQSSVQPKKALTIQTMPTICSKTCKPCTNHACPKELATKDQPCTCYGASVDNAKYYNGTISAGSSTGYGTNGSKGYDYAGYSGSDYYSGTTRGKNKNKKPKSISGYSGGDRMLKPGFVCDAKTCGFGSGPIDVGYATTVVTRFSNYTVYEILRPSKKKPSSMCRVTENVFVVKNKFRQR